MHAYVYDTTFNHLTCAVHVFAIQFVDPHYILAQLSSSFLP